MRLVLAALTRPLTVIVALIAIVAGFFMAINRMRMDILTVARLDPLAILSTVPGVLVGVVLMLLITGMTLNIQSFMGAIMAVGISVANSILLVSFAEQSRLETNDVLRASHYGATSRLRAILMTASVNPGMMVAATTQAPLLKLQQIAHLRLVVPVPESYAASVVRGKAVTFHVPAFPGKSFTGTIARIPHALDSKSRSMMVELDVHNTSGELDPGMYPTVDWPITSSGDALLVPATSVVSTTERTFVITSVNGHAHWVDVKKAPASGDSVTIGGSLSDGTAVVKRATDEIREGALLR